MGDEDVDPVEMTVRGALMTEHAVYGLILVSGMIVVSGTLTGTSLAAFTTVLITVVVFWIAHVYSAAVVAYARAGEDHHIGRAIGHAVRESSGMLVAAVPPLVILLLGVNRFIDDEAAIWTALIVDVLLLGVVGWFAVARWASSLWVRLGSALVAASLGIVLIVLKALVH